MVEKKYPDYAASAVNLCNPPEVMDLLVKYHAEDTELFKLNEEVARSIPNELKEKIAHLDQSHTETQKAIRQAIDEFGSYQDVETGEYALKQVKRTKLYSATNFESCFPEYATAVLTKSINVPVLEGLIKGNLLDEAGLRRAHIIEDKETFAYIVR